MNSDLILKTLSSRSNDRFDLYERRPGRHQLILPILHEDGDMVDLYLGDSPKGDGYVRISDYGLTLMRLTYSFEVNTPTRERIFESIVINNGVEHENGELHLDAPIDMLYEYVLQFAGCAQKVCNMRYWSRETVRSAFYEDLADHVSSDLREFNPVADVSPIPEYPTSVDWSMTYNYRNFYLFGVLNNDKAKFVAIALLEFQKARLPFFSMVVHEDFNDLGKRERAFLTNNADTQYARLVHFRERGSDDIRRFAGRNGLPAS